ncbi:MAG: COX15/CtaA family protein [Planctomycetota bacterium]|nr:COX15/CtaA family protein [Planctomycetota bacterium]
MLQKINQQQTSAHRSGEPLRADGLQRMLEHATSGSPWPNRIALTLLITTWLQICAGGLVTTSGAGMAFEDWPTSDGQNMFLYPWFGAAKDKFIEHGHRLFGATVGLIAIALCVVTWRHDPRRWVRWLTISALGLVIFQGILGGLRVRWDDVRIAKVHGCVAPLFLGLVVAIAVVTARGWKIRGSETIAAERRLRRLALFTVVMAYGQLVLGAQLRHVSVMSTGGTFQAAIFFHLFLAVVLLGEVILFWWQSERHCKRHSALLRPPRLLLALLAVQVLLGCGTWVLKYAWPGGLFSETSGLAGWTNTAGGPLQAFVVTAHVATGSLILGSSVWAALLFCRDGQQRARHRLETEEDGAVSALGVTG